MKSKGFTLLEILIAAAITSIVAGLLLMIMINSTGLFSRQSAKVQAGLNINDATAKFKSTVKQASSIAVLHITSSTTYTSDSQTLVLKVSSIDSSGNIIINTFDYYVYYLDQGILYLKTFPDSLSSRKAENRVFSTLVDSVSFQYFNTSNPPAEVVPANASKIRMTLVLKQKVGVDFETQVSTAEANLRNN